MLQCRPEVHAISLYTGLYKRGVVQAASITEKTFSGGFWIIGPMDLKMSQISP